MQSQAALLALRIHSQDTTENAHAMANVATIVCLLIGATGWYYLFYSRAAHRLRGMEHDAVNLRRIHLRRINGFLLLVLAVALFAGLEVIDAHKQPNLFIIIWTGVLILLALSITLALIDLRLTWIMRNRSD